MRPLILILLTAVAMEAQTPGTTPPSKLAEFARTERDRRAQKPLGGRVYTSEETRRGTSSPLAISSTASAPSAPAPARRETASTATKAPSGIKPIAGTPSVNPAVSPASPSPASPAAEPSADSIKEYNERVGTQRAKVRELADRYTALQIQVSEYTDQFFAPVTDANSQQSAMNKLADAQRKMDDTGRELATAQAKLREMEIQGPVKK